MRWKILMILVSILALSAGMALAAGEEKWPTKPIELVIGFVAGGSADLTARAYSPILSKELGVPVVVVSKPGATGGVASEYVAKAKPDGYTLFEANITMISRRPLTHHVNYTIDNFTYILTHSDSCWGFLVKKDAPWKDYRDFLEYARKNPGLNYGTAGTYNQAHMVAEWIAKREGLKFSLVPFKGFGAMVPALLGGHIDFGGVSGGQVPLIEGGKLRTILQISGEVPDATPVPYLTDLYPDFPQNLRYLMGSTSGLMGPKGIPEPIVQKLANAMRKAVDSESFRNYAQREKYKIVILNSAQIYEAAKKDSESFGGFLQSVGFKKE